MVKDEGGGSLCDGVGVLKMNHPVSSLVDDLNVSFSLCAHVVIVAPFDSNWTWFHALAWRKKEGTSKRQRGRSSGILWPTVR